MKHEFPDGFQLRRIVPGLQVYSALKRREHILAHLIPPPRTPMHARNSLVCLLILISSMTTLRPPAQGQVSAEAKEKMRAWAEQQRLLEPEAKEQVKAAISKEWLELDGFWYSIQTMWGGSEVVQLKNLKWTVAGDLLTSADKMNGVVWRGAARFTCEASRTYSENG